jgi:hypothetical protein
MSARTLPLLLALLCFAGMRIVGAVPGAHGEWGFEGPSVPHAALLLACESDPGKLTLQPTGVPLGLTEFAVVLPGAVWRTFWFAPASSEVAPGKRVWRAVSRGPPGLGRC